MSSESSESPLEEQYLQSSAVQRVVSEFAERGRTDRMFFARSVLGLRHLNQIALHSDAIDIAFLIARGETRKSVATGKALEFISSETFLWLYA